MKAHGLRSDLLFSGNGRADLAEECAGEIVDRVLSSPERITALYCENDIIALSILKQLQERGIRVPEQIALIGHDGLDMLKMLHPQTSTIEQPRYEMGRIAAEMLIDTIENKSEVRHITLEPKLLVGETT